MRVCMQDAYSYQVITKFVTGESKRGIPPLDSPFDKKCTCPKKIIFLTEVYLKKSSDRPLKFLCFTLLRLNFVKLLNGLVW